MNDTRYQMQDRSAPKQHHGFLAWLLGEDQTHEPNRADAGKVNRNYGGEQTTLYGKEGPLPTGVTRFNLAPNSGNVRRSGVGARPTRRRPMKAKHSKAKTKAVKPRKARTGTAKKSKTSRKVAKRRIQPSKGRRPAASAARRRGTRPIASRKVRASAVGRKVGRKAARRPVRRRAGQRVQVSGRGLGSR